MPLNPGIVIGNRYIVQSFLGRGTYGEVYQVLDGHQGVVLALKLFRPAPGMHAWHEAQVLTHLESDYILPVRNADIASGIPYLVTELAQYGTAEHGFSPLGVDPETAVRWVRAACRGTTRTHDAGLLHRDIKPGNLFRTAAGEVVLGDFGLAVLMDPSGFGPPAGTPVTLAPEVAGGASTSVSSDVYSLGATLYALIAGHYGHDGTDASSCLAAIAAGPPAPIRDVAPQISQGLAQRIEKAMARDPAARFANPADFDAALGQLPRANRRWQRTDEHGHHGCWRGAGTGPDITICAVQRGGQFEVNACYQPSGRAVPNAAQPATAPSQLPRRLRAAFGRVR